MTDDQILREIRKLHQIITRLQRVQRKVSELNFSKFKAAGTHQWAGSVKDNRYDEQYQHGQQQLRQVGPAIRSAIQTCRQKMTHLAWQVKDLKKKSEAFSITVF